MKLLVVGFFLIFATESCFGTSLEHLIEQGGVHAGFCFLLFFLVQQFKRLLDLQQEIQEKVLHVIERNTQAGMELRSAFDRLSEKLQ